MGVMAKKFRALLLSTCLNAGGESTEGFLMGMIIFSVNLVYCAVVKYWIQVFKIPLLLKL